MKKLLLLISFLWFTNVAYSQDILRYTLGEETIIRREANVNAVAIQKLPAATPVRFIKKFDKAWSFVSYNGLEGYIINTHLVERQTSTLEKTTNNITKKIDEASTTSIEYLWDSTLGCCYLNKKGEKIAVTNNHCEERGITTRSANTNTSIIPPQNASLTNKENKIVNETSSTPKEYLWDSTIGCYYLNKKGEKVAVTDNHCEEKSTTSTTSTSPNYTGPRGGVYHYTKSGKKSYYKRKN